MAPRVFDWSPIFHEHETFPKLTAWFHKCLENEHFQKTYEEFYSFWLQKEKEGQFAPIAEVVKESSEYKWKYM